MATQSRRADAMRQVTLHAVAAETALPEQGKKGEKAHEKRQKKIVIRSHSKVIYYYPTVLMALVFAFLVPESGSGVWGNIFLPLFFCNTIVVLFDFNSMRTLFFSLVGMVIGLTLWTLDLFGFISQSLSIVNVEMNSHVYGMFATFFGLMLVGDFIWSHLNRWEFSANEVKHIQAFAGHNANYPGRGLRFQVRTINVFERLLMGAGTIVLRIGKKKVRIRNVVLAHYRVRDLEKFVRTTGVFADDEDVFDEDGEDDDDDDDDDL